MYNSLVEEEDALFLCELEIMVLREKELSEEALNVMVKLNRLTFEWQRHAQN